MVVTVMMSYGSDTMIDSKCYLSVACILWAIDLSVDPARSVIDPNTYNGIV